MATPRRSHSPLVGKKPLLSVDWIVRCASNSIAKISAYKAISGRSIPNSEIDIEMQAVVIDPDGHDDGDSEPTLDLGRDLESQTGALLRRKVSHVTRRECIMHS